MKRTGPTNEALVELIRKLKKLSREKNVKIWKAVAKQLERPTRIRRDVNLFQINKHTKENEIIIVPGKVIGECNLNHKVTIAAFQFSQSAKEKCKGISIEELMKKNPEGKNIKIIG